VLSTGDKAQLNGRAARVLDPWKAGPYHWRVWRIGGGMRSVRIRLNPPSAVSRVIVSGSADWRPRNAGPDNTSPLGDIAITQHVPWALSGTLPTFSATGRLVYARRFSSGWTLIIAGEDVGPAQRVHGMFNGWMLPAADSGRRFELFYLPQRAALVWNGIAALVEAGSLLAALLLTARHKRDEDACASA